MSRQHLTNTWARACLLLALAFGTCTATAQDAIRVVTEEYPPFNYTRDGKITGLATEVVQAVLKEVGVEGKFQSMPWARAFETAKDTENVLIYAIHRSPEREPLFKWIGPIMPTNFYLFSWKNRHIELPDLDSAKAYQTGTVIQDIGESYLIKEGFTLGKNLQSGVKYEQNYEKLKLGRIDLWIMNELSAYHIARQAGDDPALTLSKAWRIKALSGTGNYMAFGNKTPDALVERFRKGLEAIKKNGTYDAIQKKWL
jgi:polar amino acid transport system substrate-binding protein